jgi:hypothetical protein
MVCFFHDETLPLASIGDGRSGSNGSGGDTANDNQIIDPAAAATLLDANTCIARMAGIVGTIHGDEMTNPARSASIRHYVTVIGRYSVQCEAKAMSALGQMQTFRNANVTSALPPKATLDAFLSDVRYGPIADIAPLIRSPRQRGRAPPGEL